MATTRPMSQYTNPFTNQLTKYLLACLVLRPNKLLSSLNREKICGVVLLLSVIDGMENSFKGGYLGSYHIIIFISTF